MRSIDCFVTVFMDDASGKIEFFFKPNVCSSDSFITVSWAPVSGVAVRARAYPAPAFLTKSGALSPSYLFASLSSEIETSTVGEALGGDRFQDFICFE